MRVLLGRGNWRPRVRIENTLRYAFIGDSNTYGVGVAPDQTLPVNAERQMNELIAGWPVECANLGVSGYNIWNSWLAFRHERQVYDGVILVLCTNDADLFDRSYSQVYSEPDPSRWESTHPIGVAVARCFDEIASFSKEHSLPIAFVYFQWPGTPNQTRIGRIIADLCASHSLCFIDSLMHYHDRNFTDENVVVSSADAHPSAIAHEAMGRHLVATLKQQGWFRNCEASTIDAAPDRILATARAMVDNDYYPTDAALNWALRALDAKSLLARRIEGIDGLFESAATRVDHALKLVSRRWHAANCVRAIVRHVSTAQHGLVWGLYRSQEERLRLDELAFALGMRDWSHLRPTLLNEADSLPTPIQVDWPAEAASFLDNCVLELLSLQDDIKELGTLAAPTQLGTHVDEASMLADLEWLWQIADRTKAECIALKEAFLRLENTLSDVGSRMSGVDLKQVSNLVTASLQRIKQGFFFVRRLSGAIENTRDGRHPAFTTVEVTCEVVAEGKWTCWLVGTIEYGVPNRLSFQDSGGFWTDGASSLVKLRFPTFYAGRLSLLPFMKRVRPGREIDIAILKVEAYNNPSRRIVIDPAHLSKDPQGRFVSPFFYLP